MSEPSNAFQLYNTRIDPLVCSTAGIVYEYNGTSVEYMTGMGLITKGLVIGLGDYWQYDDNAQTITWTWIG